MATVQRASRHPRPADRLLRGLESVLVATSVVALALDGAGSSIHTRSLAAVLVWWTVGLGVALGVWPRARLPRAAIVVGAALAALTAMTAVSALWAASDERAFAAATRMSLYLGAFLIAALAVRPSEAERWSDAIGAGIAVVGALAVGQRLLPGVFGPDDLVRELPDAGTRLSYPLGYWNGLGIFLALALPLLLRGAAAERPPLARGLAVLPLPALAAAIYMTSSRGAVAVVVVGVAAMLIAAPRRFAMAQALVAGGLGAAAAVAVVLAHPAVLDAPYGSAEHTRQAGVAAWLIAGTCLLACGLAIASAMLLPARLEVGARLRALAVAVVAAAVVVAAVLARPAERFEVFKAPPRETDTGAEFVRSHLLSGGGSGRWQFWSSAVDQFREHPVLGGGAGSYEPWWAQHGSIAYFVRNAHSLWLETLGELGLVGVLLLGVAFVAGLVCAIARGLGGANDAGRSVAVALGALLAAFMAGAALDWIWQLPVVAIVAMLALGLLTGGATAASTEAPAGQLRVPARVVRAVTAVVALVVILANASLLLADSELSRSRAAVARGDLQGAADHAAAARALQPWAASPELQLALVFEEAGELPDSRRYAAAAIGHDRTNWRLRLVAARVAAKTGAIRAARRELTQAKRLNPRSPVLKDASRE